MVARTAPPHSRLEGTGATAVDVELFRVLGVHGTDVIVILGLRSAFQQELAASQVGFDGESVNLALHRTALDPNGPPPSELRSRGWT